MCYVSTVQFHNFFTYIESHPGSTGRIKGLEQMFFDMRQQAVVHINDRNTNVTHIFNGLRIDGYVNRYYIFTGDIVIFYRIF